MPQSQTLEVPSCDSCSLLPHTLYGILDTTELAGLRGTPPVRMLPRGSIIAHVGETPTDIYSVRSGWAFRFILLPDGRRQILSFYLPGDIISLEGLFGRPLWFAVQALSSVVLCAFDRAALDARIKNDDKLLKRAEDYRVLHAAHMDRRLVDIGKRRAIERVVLLLLDIEKRFSNLGEIAPDGSFPFLLRHEHIADALGLTRVHVSRTLSTLRRENIISGEDERLTISDHPMLRKLAGAAESEPDARYDGIFA